MNIDLIKLQTEWKYYFHNYGNDKFVENAGTEIILKCFHDYIKTGVWLDLGGGSNSLFWGIPQKVKNKLVVLDNSIESKIVLETINKYKIVSGCYEYVMTKFKKGVDDVFRKKIKFVKNDFFSNPKFTNKKFKNISQIGLLGLCKNEDEYFSSLSHIIKMLKKGGVFIGANWIFNDEYATKRGFKNDYITKEFIIESLNMIRAKCNVLEYHEISVDANFKGVIIYVVSK